jgi:hypothetical protein
MTVYILTLIGYGVEGGHPGLLHFVPLRPYNGME